jgi:hypothetical protein
MLTTTTYSGLTISVDGLRCENVATFGVDARCVGFERLVVGDTVEFSRLSELWELPPHVGVPIYSALDDLAQKEMESV